MLVPTMIDTVPGGALQHANQVHVLEKNISDDKEHMRHSFSERLGKRAKHTDTEI